MQKLLPGFEPKICCALLNLSNAASILFSFKTQLILKIFKKHKVIRVGYFSLLWTKCKLCLFRSLDHLTRIFPQIRRMTLCHLQHILWPLEDSSLWKCTLCSRLRPKSWALRRTNHTWTKTEHSRVCTGLDLDTDQSIVRSNLTHSRSLECNNSNNQAMTKLLSTSLKWKILLKAFGKYCLALWSLLSSWLGLGN